jgi:hypothetical protein
MRISVFYGIFTICLSIVFLLQSRSGAAQELADTLQFSAIKRTKIARFAEDIYFLAGTNTGGLRSSNNFRYLRYGYGFTLAVEKYYPIGKQVFFYTGINYSKRSFYYEPAEGKLKLCSSFVEIPLLFSYEMPALRRYDFRFLLGSMTSFRLKSQIKGDYEGILNRNPEVFQYRVSDFQKLDFGWVFGCSFEYRNFFLRFRNFTGLVKIDRKEQGMYHSLHLDFGIFPFRNIFR